MKKDDVRFQFVKDILDSGGRFGFRDIFGFFPISLFSRNLPMGRAMLKSKMKNPGSFTLEDIMRFAALFKMEPEQLSHQIFKELSDRIDLKEDKCAEPKDPKDN